MESARRRQGRRVARHRRGPTGTGPTGSDSHDTPLPGSEMCAAPSDYSGRITSMKRDHNRSAPAGKIERRSVEPRAATSLMRRPGSILVELLDRN